MDMDKLPESSEEVKSFAEGIAGELFDSGKTEAEEAPAVEAPSLGETAQAVPENTPPIEAKEIKPSPKSWKKDMESHWSKLDPAVHEYVYNREADVMRGLQMYQDGYNRWNKLIQPYSHLLQQDPNFDSVGLMQNLMQSHLTLISGSPEQKRAFAQKLLTDYGIDLSPQPAQQGEENPLNRELVSLRQELQSLKSGFTEQQRRIYDEGLAQQRQVVDAFFSDPKNEFADELGNDILHLIKAGAAKDLPAAYEMAVWMNPSTRAKMLAKQAQPAEPAKAGKGEKFPNIESSTEAPRRRQPRKSMDDTINEVIQKYAGLQ